MNQKVKKKSICHKKRWYKSNLGYFWT